MGRMRAPAEVEIERLRKQIRALKIALTTIKASAGSQTVYDIAAAALRDAK